MPGKIATPVLPPSEAFPALLGPLLDLTWYVLPAWVPLVARTCCSDKKEGTDD